MRWLLLALLCAQPATLVRVIDGDTYVLDVALGFDVTKRATIRLHGLDTPERSSKRGAAATQAAFELLHSGTITVKTSGRRSFSRWVADVYVDGKSVAEELREGGHEK